MELLDIPVIDPDIRKAKLLPGSFYRSTTIFELMKTELFPRSWQWIASADALERVGQVLPFQFMKGLLDEPLLFVLDEGPHLRCISNVCTHRGNELIQKPCKVSKIRCRYHGRTFDLSGEVMHAPGFEDAEDFPCDSDDLKKIPWAQLGKHLFASLDPLIPFQTWIGPIADRLSWLPINGFMLDSGRSKTYKIKANWALYVDNYLERLHIPFVHPGLNAKLNLNAYEEEIYEWGTLQVGIAKGSEQVFEIPESSQDYGKKVAAYYFWLFPNTMLNFYPWGLSINIVRPISVDRTEVSYITYVGNPALLPFGAGGDLEQVEKEDTEIVESVQKGIQSSLDMQGRYSPKYEQGIHHFHQLLTKAIRKD